MRDIVELEHPVEITQLERCVRRYWDEAARDDERPLYRALTMNLVAVAPAEDESLLRATFQQLLRSNPCIAFLVLLTEDESPLRATFGTHVEIGRNARTVLLERVTFRASRSERRKVPSLIRPLLLDDLPTQLLWSGALPDDLRLLRDLGKLADQVVYDSCLFADPQRDVARIEALDLTTVDLAWIRLKPWRRALAEAFEHAAWQPGMAARARIRHAGTLGTRAASARLARWLEKRLDAEVEIVTEPHCSAPSFEPCALELTCDGVEIEIEHRWPSPTITVSTTLQDRCLLPFTAVSQCCTRGELLAAATETLGVAGVEPVRR